MDNENDKVPKWKIILWLLGFLFFLSYGVVSFYIDAYRFIIYKFSGG